eukprot:5465946-Amphidinium_carterae.2
MSDTSMLTPATTRCCLAKLAGAKGAGLPLVVFQGTAETPSSACCHGQPVRWLGWVLFRSEGWGCMDSGSAQQCHMRRVSIRPTKSPTLDMDSVTFLSSTLAELRAVESAVSCCAWPKWHRKLVSQHADK